MAYPDFGKNDLKNLPAFAHLVEFLEAKLLKVSVDERAYSNVAYDELKTIKKDIDNIPEDRFNTELAKIIARRGMMETRTFINHPANDLSTQPQSETEGVEIVDNSIFAAPAEDLEPAKYDLDDWDVLSDKNDKEAISETRNLDRSSEQIDATELEIENIKRGETSDDGENTVESSQSSTFDHDSWGRGTRPSTVPTSYPGLKEKSSHQVSAIPEAGELGITSQEETGPANLEDMYSPDPLAQDQSEEQQADTGEDDAKTGYSVETIPDNPKPSYLQDFAEQLTEDMKQFSDESSLGNIGADYLDTVLRDFARKLHCDSFESEEDEDVISENEDHDEAENRVPHRKSTAELTQWRNNVAISPSEDKAVNPSTEDDYIQSGIDHEHGLEEPFRRLSHSFEIPSQLPHYKEFIRESDAYHWLLSSIRQHNLLAFDKSDAMLEITTKIRNQLRAQKSLLKMSRRKPSSVVKMTFTFDCNSAHFMHDTDLSLLREEALNRTARGPRRKL
ncbi:hypothetical protein MKX08_009475 [Trichoderma sp. CBMAI-0020]|nr:hypothetical protein MKX08_009475 [Trichoderma sp. CBMAI-0020]